jgi:hypothetical protein
MEAVDIEDNKVRCESKAAEKSCFDQPAATSALCHEGTLPQIDSGHEVDDRFTAIAYKRTLGYPHSTANTGLSNYGLGCGWRDR